jgi:osmotically-inducible protein OsmY
MKHFSLKLALLSILTLGSIQFVGQPHQSHTATASNQPQEQQPAEAPPYEFNIDDSVVEQAIKDKLGKDPRMPYSNVAVHVTDTRIILTGTVNTSTVKAQAAKIAAQNAGARKIENQLQVTPNPHSEPRP